MKIIYRRTLHSLRIHYLWRSERNAEPTRPRPGSLPLHLLRNSGIQLQGTSSSLSKTPYKNKKIDRGCNFFLYYGVEDYKFYYFGWIHTYKPNWMSLQDYLEGASRKAGISYNLVISSTQTTYIKNYNILNDPLIVNEVISASGKSLAPRI